MTVLKFERIRYQRMKPPPIKSTHLQRAHRQVAWAVYISEGFAANVRHAAVFNSLEMPPKARHQLEAMVRDVEGHIRVLRRYL
jgi:hypothetical protein